MMIGIQGRSRDPDLAWSFAPDKDPEISIAASVVQRFCQEVWNAGLHPSLRRPGGIPLSTLAVGVSGLIETLGPENKNVDGPISALYRTLCCYGWTICSPFVWASKYGNEVRLLDKCPTQVVSLFKADVQDTILQRGIERIHSRHDNGSSQSLLDNAPLFSPLRSLYRSLGKREARTLLAIVSNGIFTNTGLLYLGYDIEAACPSCGLSLDTIYHRCYTCPNASGRAQHTLGEALYNSIIYQGENSILANQLLCPAPLPSNPPLDSVQRVFVGMSDSDCFRPEDGFIFGDGSCTDPCSPWLARAGFAVVQITAEGEVLKGFYGNVPSSLPRLRFRRSILPLYLLPCSLRRDVFTLATARTC